MIGPRSIMARFTGLCASETTSIAVSESRSRRSARSERAITLAHVMRSFASRGAGVRPAGLTAEVLRLGERLADREERLVDLPGRRRFSAAALLVRGLGRPHVIGRRRRELGLLALVARAVLLEVGEVHLRRIEREDHER